MKSLLALVAAAGALHAADYYVATTGQDTDSGGKDRPFRTIARGLAAARIPGDNVIIRGGVYPQQRTLNLANAGAQDRPITLRAFPGEEAILQGVNTPKDASLIAVLTHHVRIEDLTLRNSAGDGITVWGPGSRVHHVEVVGNRIHHCQRSGVYVAFNNRSDPVRDVLVEANTVHHNVLMNQRPPRTRWAFALGAGPSSHVTLRKNLVYLNYGEGIGFYLSDHGVAEANVAHDNFSVNVYLDNTTHTRINRNLVYSTGDRDFYRFGHPASGIQIANEEYGGLSNPSSQNEIINNILIGNRYAFYYGNYQRGGGLQRTLFAHNTASGSTGPLLHIDADTGHQDSRIVNNIFQQVGSAPITDLEGPTDQIQFRNNLWQGGVPHPSARGAGDVYADPCLLNGRAGTAEGCRLRSTSPARNAGIEIGRLNRDFGGRPRGRRIDLGAWQFDPTIPAASPRNARRDRGSP